MRTWLLSLFISIVASLAGCGGGGSGDGGPSSQATAAVAVDPSTARVNIDNVIARVDFSPGREAFGPGASISWALATQPAGSSATLSANSAVLFPTGAPSDLQTAAAVVLSPDVAGTYTLQATVNYGIGLGSAMGTANVTAVHAMSFSVQANDPGGVLSPSPNIRTWAAIASDANIASVEAFLDGQSLGLLPQTNMTIFCDGQHGIPCPPYAAYGYIIPKVQLTGSHSLTWVVSGEAGSGINGEDTVLIGSAGLLSDALHRSFGIFSGNP